MTRFVTVCKAGEIPSGSGRSFRIGDKVIGVFYLDGRYYALDDRCPHAGALLSLGSIEGGKTADDAVVRCRIHHWGFCLASGRYVDQDIPQYDATTYPIRVVDDEVQIEIGKTDQQE